MPIGPGKYGDAHKHVRERFHLAESILIVFEGPRGPSFECTASLATTLRIPEILREVANQIEADARRRAGN